MSSISALNSLLGGSSNSSGIDISSIIQALTGSSSSGIDVTTAVTAAVTAAEAPATAWSNTLTSLESQDTALTQIQSDVQNLDNDLQQLNSITGPLASATVTSSNSSVVSATAAAGSTQGSHQVTVTQLATASSWVSSEFSSGSATVPAGSITITPAGGTAQTITTDGTQSLSDVASQINSDNLGVTANVVTDANGSRLSIESTSTGSASSFTINASSNFGANTVTAGQNAALTVDGISISSASNTVAGALPGVTLNLQSTGQASLSVQPDASAASTAITQFVTDYNTVIGDLNAQFTNGASGQGPLAEDASIINLQSAVEQSLSFLQPASTGTTTDLSSLGISINKDGTLALNSSTLQNTLQNNFSGVQQFFQGSALNGFANNMDKQLSNFLAPGNGAFTVELSSISTQETTLKGDITNFMNTVITPLQSRLTAQFSQAETELQELPGELKQISAEFNPNSNNS